MKIEWDFHNRDNPFTPETLRELKREFAEADIVTRRTSEATLKDRGVWKAADCYLPGEGVSDRGAYWICRAVTADRPGTAEGASAWRLAVKGGKGADPRVRRSER